MTASAFESFASAPCGLFQARDDGSLLQVNDYLANLFSVSKEALRGSYLDRFFTRPSRVVLHTHVVPNLKLHGRIEEIELTLELPDGKRLTALLNASRVAPAGAPARIDGVLFCVRQRRDLEAQLINAQRVIDHVPGMLFQLLLRADGSAALPYASPGIHQLHGIPAKHVNDDARAFWDSIEADDVEAVREGLDQARRALSIWHGRYRTHARGETRWLDAHATPQPLPDGSTLFHGYVSDVTARVKMDEALREVAVAERASQAKTQFLGRVSHELRNPLTCLLGFSELLISEQDDLGERSREMLQNIELAARTLQALLDDLLDLSSIESGTETLRLEYLSLSYLVRSVAQMLAPVAHTAGIALDVQIADDLSVFADDRRLRQVVLNLLSNAVKYNRVNGVVTVRAQAEGKRVRLTVSDQGRGMTPEQLSCLFQPFNRLGAEGTVRGTGLGLVITRTLVEHMRGTIEVSSVPGVGSSFAALLPREKPIDP